jgi:hypothetical protein
MSSGHERLQQSAMVGAKDCEKVRQMNQPLTNFCTTCGHALTIMSSRHERLQQSIMVGAKVSEKDGKMNQPLANLCITCGHALTIMSPGHERLQQSIMVGAKVCEKDGKINQPLANLCITCGHALTIMSPGHERMQQSAMVGKKFCEAVPKKKGKTTRGKRGSGKCKHQREKACKKAEAWFVGSDKSDSGEHLSVAHTLSEDTIASLERRGTTVIVLCEPSRQSNSQRSVNWKLKKGMLPPKIDGIHLSTSSLLIVAKVSDVLQLEKKICYIGGRGPENFVVLASVIKVDDQIAHAQPNFNGKEMVALARHVRNSIFKSDPSSFTSHFGTTGDIRGIGARAAVSDPVTGSTVKQYSPKGGKHCEAKETFQIKEKKLIQQAVRQMSIARKGITKFFGRDFVRENATQTLAAANLCKKWGMEEDFHILGETCFASVYQCCNAATSIPHTENDWTMTLLFVPDQCWANKGRDHLRFVFHLNDHQQIHAAMGPLVAVYYHGNLITHHQQHHQILENPNEPCCVNYAGYSNQRVRQRLRCSIQRLSAKHSLS